MNSELFNRLLQAEAETLYHQCSTPESFVSRIKPIIQELVKENRTEIMSENDMETILTSSKSRNNQSTTPKNSYFDVVDLCLYRAN
jgi:hypothetical protein